MSDFVAHLDADCRALLSEVVLQALFLPQYLQPRVHMWCDKLHHWPTAAVREWQITRRAYCRLLLQQVQNRALSIPFDKVPPSGPLPSLPYCLTLSSAAPRRRHGPTPHDAVSSFDVLVAQHARPHVPVPFPPLPPPPPPPPPLSMQSHHFSNSSAPLPPYPPPPTVYPSTLSPMTSVSNSKSVLTSQSVSRYVSPVLSHALPSSSLPQFSPPPVPLTFPSPAPVNNYFVHPRLTVTPLCEDDAHVFSRSVYQSDIAFSTRLTGLPLPLGPVSVAGLEEGPDPVTMVFAAFHRTKRYRSHHRLAHTMLGEEDIIPLEPLDQPTHDGYGHDRVVLTFTT
jgi:hypothetical protein